MSSENGPATGRFLMLDGLRGGAALVVVIFHLMIAFMPWMVPGQGAAVHWLTDTPLALFYNGPFAVSVFFVLSGFVIAHSAAKSRSPIWLNPVLRYVRLAVPVLASVIFAWGLLFLFPDATMRLRGVLPHDWLQWVYQGDVPGLPFAIYSGAVQAFTGGTLFNNALWTMKFEIIGSVALYIIYAVLAGRARLIGLVVFACVLEIWLKPAYVGFFLGALLRELWVSGGHKPVFPAGVFLLGLLLGFPSSGFTDRLGLPPMPGALGWDEKYSLLPPVASALIVYGALYAKRVGGMLSSRVPQFLGRISFPLYLIHVPMIYTIFAAMYVRNAPVGALGLCGIFLSFFFMAIILAIGGAYLIDAPVLRLVSRLRGYYFRRGCVGTD